jgi:hypothetical protein
VADVVCDDSFGYWAGLDSIWGKGRTIVNLEHDVEFSDDLVAELLSCPRDLCAYPYTVRPASWPGLAYGALFSGWLTTEVPFAHFSAIGFAKISASVQTSPLAKRPWQRLEDSIHEAVARNQRLWHLHWPAIGHRHDYDSEPPPETGSAYEAVQRARADGRLYIHGEEPDADVLKRCDPFLYDKSLRDRVPVL